MGFPIIWKKHRTIARQGNQQNYANWKTKVEIVTWNYPRSETNNMGVSLWVSEKEKRSDWKVKKRCSKTNTVGIFSAGYFCSLLQIVIK